MELIAAADALVVVLRLYVSCLRQRHPEVFLFFPQHKKEQITRTKILLQKPLKGCLARCHHALEGNLRRGQPTPWGGAQPAGGKPRRIPQHRFVGCCLFLIRNLHKIAYRVPTAVPPKQVRQAALGDNSYCHVLYETFAECRQLNLFGA